MISLGELRQMRAILETCGKAGVAGEQRVNYRFWAFEKGWQDFYSHHS
jgi:hypothetical protein